MADNSAKLNFIVALTDMVTGPLGKVNASFTELASGAQKGLTQMGVGAAGMVATGYALQAAMGPAIDQQRALGEVKSLGVAAESLDLLNQKSLEFAINYGENAQAFVRSAYDIQSAIAGLTGTQLATFTNASNVLAKATKADAATITNYVGTMYGIFKDQADAMGKGEWVENLAGVTATAVQMFKTTGQGMSDAFTAVGANATAAGIGLNEQVAILGTLQATMSGGEAGTKYKSFLAGIGSAQGKLGLKFTDAQGAMLPVLQILDKIKGKFGDTLDVAESDALKAAFGSDEAVSMIKLLMADTDGLANSLNALGKVKGMEQAQTMAEAMVDPWAQFASTIEVLKIAFGQLIGPALTPLLKMLTEGGAKILKWTNLFPHLTKVIGMTVLSVIALIAAMSLFTLGMGMAQVVMKGFIVIQKIFRMGWLQTVLAVASNILWGALYVALLGVMAIGMGTVSAAMMIWQGIIWLVNAAMWANPILLIVAGIVALVAVVIAAIYYWDEWTAALLNSAAFTWLNEQFLALSNWLASFGTLASEAWSAFTTAWSDLSVFDLLGDAANGLIELLNQIPGINIETRFATPTAPGTAEALGVATGPGTPEALHGALVPGVPEAMQAADQANMATKAQQTINGAIPSLLPAGPSEVPAGGLMQSFQNNTTQNKGTQIGKVEIHTSQPLSQHELDKMLEMAAG
ncbi:phage tail tape measure protein [Pseudomonas sp. SIMBA_041]|uniref:phage tail tape measure protein n=1 Tax=Pseudomonas sp. SIMBA_041 TaxID=3085782 RepID=UPI0039799473